MTPIDAAPPRDDFPFLRPVPVVGLLDLAGEEVETVSLEVIQMWMSHLRERFAADAHTLAHGGTPAAPDPAEA